MTGHLATVATVGAAMLAAALVQLCRPAPPGRRDPLPAPRRRTPRPIRARQRTRLLDDAYPDALDLFVLAVQAGLTPLDAVRELRPFVHPLVAQAFDAVCIRVARGDRFADALDSLVAPLGIRAVTFVSTVSTAERTGQPLGPMVDRLADDARRHRRQSMESAARELPVRLSFPLVLCTLPSFALVAIAPLVVGAFSSLRT